MIRSRNISAIVVIQDEAQLEKIYGIAAKGIISNCESYVFLGSSNIETCNTVAQRLSQKGITGDVIRMLSHDKCVVISGNTGGVFDKYRLEEHPQYKRIADNDNSNFYKLEIKHNVYSVCDYQWYSEQKWDIEYTGVLKKEDIFDSFEEKYLFKLLQKIPNINVCVHQHLRDIFKSSDTAYSIKLSQMHCDFVIRDENFEIMLGIEIDGQQHRRDEKQIINDLMKKDFFENNEIPLLHFNAKEVRESAREVINEICKNLSELDSFPREFTSEILDYYNECKKDPLGQKELEYLKYKRKETLSFTKEKKQDENKIKLTEEEETDIFLKVMEEDDIFIEDGELEENKKK